MKVWQTTRTNYTVSDFITWYREGSLKLNPDFQRRSVWKPGAKSFLIDTIMRGLPIPIILIRELASDLKTFKPRRDVVDGQQRLRTIIAFIAPDLLKDFERERDLFRIKANHSKEYGGKTFTELPEDVQQGILDYQFSVHKFPSDTDDRELVQVFARMNSTGTRLNAQELRNAEFYGPFKTVAQQLAAEQLSRWRKWHVFTADNIARMDEFELTSEFMIMMRQGISEKSEKTITAAYKAYEEHDFVDGEEIARRFRAVFGTIETHFANDIVRLFSRRTIFYALFAAVYDLQFGLEDEAPENWYISALKPTKPKPLSSKAVENILQAGNVLAQKGAPESIMNTLTRRTTHAKERRLLASYFARAKGK